MLSLDQIYIHETTEKGDRKDYPSGANLRAAELGLSIPITKDWDVTLDLSLPGVQHIDFAYLSYKGFTNTSLFIGQVPSPFCLERQESLKWQPFLEKSLATNTFAPCIGPGVAFGQWFEHVSYRASLVQAPYGMFASEQDNQGSDQWGGTFRGSYVPSKTVGKVIQLGGAISYQQLNKSMEYAVGPEFRARYTPKLISTSARSGKIQSGHYEMASLEAAAQQGSLQGSAEYFISRVPRSEANLAALHFYGYHAQVNYFLTPHIRQYKFENSNFGAPKVSDTAWQVAYRLSHVNLNDQQIHGGKETNHTVALSYYLNASMKITGNYIRALILTGGDQRKKDLDVLGVRWQTVF
jgi:phosphate-selective porin OprO/OprP